MDTNAATPLAPGQHTLPPLPYAYDALEPVLDAEIVEIHHDRHHKKYVDDLNQAELDLVEARRNVDYKTVNLLENRLAFNGSGHILHSLYWTGMAAPGSGGEPGANTRSHIDWYFGGLEPFRKQFTAAATGVAGSGWAILGYQPAFRRLELLQCEKHENLTQWGMVPIMVCDVWEHAYYLHYRNDRAEYVNGWWRLVNWADVERRFVEAVQGRLPLNP